jgi:hypothetical protein
MPDGVVTSKRGDEAGTSGLGSAVRDGLDGLLRACRAVAGRRGEFGSSEPALVLSWGSGWEPTWRARCPRAEILPTGSPRADDYAGMPPRSDRGNLLVCSQPLFLPQHRSVKQQADSWYEWLIRLHRMERPRLRIRLHPSERSDRYPLPADLLPAPSAEPTPLHDDLRWADVVVAPFSSVLVEALAAGRVPVAAGGTKVWGAFADNDFLADPRIPVIDFRADGDPQAYLDRADDSAGAMSDLRDEFLANLGTAAPAAARALAR